MALSGIIRSWTSRIRKTAATRGAAISNMIKETEQTRNILSSLCRQLGFGTPNYENYGILSGASDAVTWLKPATQASVDALGLKMDALADYLGIKFEYIPPTDTGHVEVKAKDGRTVQFCERSRGPRVNIKQS